MLEFRPKLSVHVELRHFRDIGIVSLVLVVRNDLPEVIRVRSGYDLKK